MFLQFLLLLAVPDARKPVFFFLDGCRLTVTPQLVNQVLRSALVMRWNPFQPERTDIHIY